MGLESSELWEAAPQPPLSSLTCGRWVPNSHMRTQACKQAPEVYDGAKEEADADVGGIDARSGQGEG